MRYIGSVLVKVLQDKNYFVVGLDAGYFNTILSDIHITNYPKITKDLRDVKSEDLIGINQVIHLGDFQMIL